MCSFQEERIIVDDKMWRGRDNFRQSHKILVDIFVEKLHCLVIEENLVSFMHK